MKIKTVGLLLGQEASFEVGSNVQELHQLLQTSTVKNQLTAGAGTSAAPRPAEVADMLRTLASQSSGPALLFAVINGRTGTNNTHGQKRIPHSIYGAGLQDEQGMLDALATEACKTGKPLDVFLLTSQKPDYIHPYAQKLPAGSVVAAFMTDPTQYRERRFLDFLSARMKTKPDHELSARNLLIGYLLSEQPGSGLPAIAVSGQPAHSLHDVWNAMAGQGGISTEALGDLRTIQREILTGASLSSPAQSMAVSAQDAIDRAVTLTYNITVRPPPASHAHRVAYAAALLTMWDKMLHVPRKAASTGTAPVQPQHSTGSVSTTSHSTNVVQQGQTTGSVSSGKGGPLTEAEMAQVPKNLRKAAQAAPGTFRKILRRH